MTKHILRRLRGHEKGFTLVEMMVVMAIVSVLAAIVFPAVSGVGTTSHTTRQAEDVRIVQGGIDRFNAESGYWPTGTADGGSNDGILPTTALVPGAVTSAMIKGITFNKQYDVSPTVTKTLVPDYVRSNPLYYNDTNTMATDDTADTKLLKSGKTYATSGGNWTIGASDIDLSGADFGSIWVVDSTGRAYVIKDHTVY